MLLMRSYLLRGGAPYGSIALRRICPFAFQPTLRLKVAGFASTQLLLQTRGPTANDANDPEKKTSSQVLRKTVNTLREDIYTIPNVLTFSRLVAAPIIGYLVVHGHSFYALGLFVCSCVTDFFDGYIARKFNMHTVVGSVIDPMADKALMMTLASCLAISGDIPLYAAVIILGRDILLGLSAFYYRWISLPPPKTFTRYFDFSIPSAEVHPTTISKYNTFLQMIYLGSSLALPALTPYIAGEWPPILSCYIGYLGYTVCTTTVLSGLSYVFSRDAVKILTK
jgi:cardiolipin synthase